MFNKIQCAESNHTVKIFILQEGVFIRSLYLEGADWDSENACLRDSVPLKFISHLPVIQFKPVQTIARKKGKLKVKGFINIRNLIKIREFKPYKKY